MKKLVSLEDVSEDVVNHLIDGTVLATDMVVVELRTTEDGEPFAEWMLIDDLPYSQGLVKVMSFPAAQLQHMHGIFRDKARYMAEAGTPVEMPASQ